MNYYNIKTKIIFYFSFFAMIVSIIFGYLIFVYLKNEITKEVEKGIYYDTLDAADIIKTRNEVSYTYLSGLAKRETISDTNISIEEKLKILEKEVIDEYGFKHIDIADKSGILYLLSDDKKEIKKIDIKEREYFKQSLKGNRFVQSPTVSLNPDDNGEIIVVYSLPIFNDGEIIGVLVAVGDGWALNDLTDYLRLSEHQYAYIVDENSLVIAHPDRSLVEMQFNISNSVKYDKGYVSTADMIEKSRKNQAGVLKYTYKNKNIITGHAKIKETNWSVYVAIPENEAFKFLTSLQKILIFYTLIIIAFTIIMYFKIKNELEIANFKIKNKQTKLEFNANYDELTGIYNRREGLKLLENNMKNSIVNKEPLSIAYLDIDNLKNVNDSLGHDIGDNLISKTVELIKEVIRSTDLIARLGGDEFLIIFNDCSEENTIKIIEAILVKFDMYNKDAEKFYIEISFGIEEYRSDFNMSAKDLINKADKKMYEYKKNKKEIRNNKKQENSSKAPSQKLS